MRPPKFSVITVSFNHGEFLRQNIDSVLAQNWPNFEHIVIDGGSTDDTLEILKSYPHLQWISEPDRGQSDALNKGFERARGDIIAWLNSDDWYPPNIFAEIAHELETHPIVLGSCQLTDREGNLTNEPVPNIERNWFDILKYWVYYSSPHQPSIFFRRELLDRCKLPNGKFIDEDLDYTMDYELWLRMTQYAAMDRRVPTLFSYYRHYDTNKTGASMDAVYREFSGTFKRHAKRRCLTQQAFSFLLPLNKAEPALGQFLKQLREQSLLDLEVLVIDYASDRSDSKALQKQILSLGDSFRPGALRMVRSMQKDWFAALDQGLQSARADFLVYLPFESEIGKEFCLQAYNRLSQDNLALILPGCGDLELQQQLTAESPRGRIFQPGQLFGSNYLLPPFILRSVAAQELGGFKRHWEKASSVSGFRELALHLIFKGWQLAFESALPVKALARRFEGEVEKAELFRNYINSQIVCDLTSQLNTDPFSQLRAQHGFAIVFDAQVYQSALKLLAACPADWMHIDENTSPQRLQQIAVEFPNFAPAHFYLARHYLSSGSQQHRESEVRFQQARQFEVSL